jgi:hypothetical protein
MASHTDAYFFSAHCKHFQCSTLTHSTNEDLLNIKRKGDPKSCTLSRTSDITETRNPCVIKAILLACSTYKGRSPFNCRLYDFSSYVSS